MSLQVDIVSPEKVLFEGDAQMLVARSADGEIAFLTGHIPFIGVLRPDTVRIHLTDGNKINLDVESGFIEVSKDRITVLSDTAQLQIEE